jgi:protein gp37
MADTTGIEWTDRTYNPWIGCHKVSEGCKHCYAETLSLQKKFVTAWNKTGERKVTKTALEPEKWNLEALENKTRYTVFCASLSDVFEEHPALPELREDLWRLIKRTPFLDWMILTKRAENIATMLPTDWGAGYENVCLMVSVENQKWFDKRVTLLRAIPAKYRALSVEPLVGHVRMPAGSLDGIDLVIVGGESDKDARPMNPNWVRHIRDACAKEGVDFFFKQWGNWTPDKAHAEADLSNGAYYPDYEAEPILLSSVAGEAARKAIVKTPGNQTVYFAKSKKGTGSQLDGKHHKDHPFLASRIKKTTTPVILPLTKSEKEELESLEVIVSSGLKSFWEAGKALRKIRDRGLYRDTHKTFEDYCHDKWEMSRAEAYRQIGAASVIEDISTSSPTILPTTISQTRPLLKLKTAEERRSAWGEVTKTPGRAITAEVVKDAVESIRKPAGKRKTKAAPKPAKAAAPTYPVREKFKKLTDDLEAAANSANLKKITELLPKLKALLSSIKD